MYELCPYFTLDGSVGLYSPDVEDIYHSTYGAAQEAYEKFILPANFEKYFENNNKIKILDICYGIGYNSKIFLKNFFENINNETIDTYNIIYNDKIDTNNKKYKISIDAVDQDEILINLSPFFKIGNLKDIKNQKLIFENDRIEKILTTNNTNKYKDINSVILNLIQNLNLKRSRNKFGMTIINIILLNILINNINSNTEEILSNKKYKQFFDSDIIAYYKHLKNKLSVEHHLSCLNSFLHNIYYKYISTSHKIAIKAFNNVDIDFNAYSADIRRFIKQTHNTYNYVFLDGFTPDKCPCIWTLDFFKELYEHLEDNGVILTYTNSAKVRNAMINTGFKIYKIYSKSQNKFCGTLAVKSKCHSELVSESDLLHSLSKFDLDLLKTKAGIFYRDKNLEHNNEEIIKQNIEDVKNSNLISVTQYKKNCHPEFN